MIIRPARAEDAADLAAVHVQSWQSAYRGLVPQDFLDGLDVGRRTASWERILGDLDERRAGAFVAEADVIVGFAHVCASRDEDLDPDDVGEVTSIYLHPSSWGTGAGGALMAAGLGHLDAAGFGRAMLWVIDGNKRARRFYEHGGWRADGTTKRDDRLGFTLTEVRYLRPLP